MLSRGQKDEGRMTRLKATLDSMQKCGLYDDDSQIESIMITRCHPSSGGYISVHIVAIEES